MSAPIEIQISQHLKEHSDFVQVAEDLVLRWEKNLLSPEEQSAAAQFLINAKFYSLLLAQVQKALRAGAPVPWPQLIECLGSLGHELSPDETDLLLTVIQDENAMDQVLRSFAADQLHPDFQTEREKLTQKKALDLAKKRLELRDKLRYVRSQRLLDEEARVLQELQALFPGDSEFILDRKEFDERWAREVIAQRTNQSPMSRRLSQELKTTFEVFSPEQELLQLELKNLVLEFAKSKPKTAYDLALLLHFVDMNAEALELLSFAEPNEAVIWFQLELKLRSRRFVEALELASELEVSHAASPDKMFAAVYARAQALWGLSQRVMAIDLMRSIVQVRPNYKMAHSLLSTWTNYSGYGGASTYDTPSKRSPSGGRR